MILKVFLNPKLRLSIFACAFLFAATSCTPRAIKPSSEPIRLPIPDEQIPSEPTVEKLPEVKGPNPRMLASLQLTQQAQSYILAGQADGAIRILERAVALDPSNGQNYYYLAEAWLVKKNMGQALNFNDLAMIHLGSDPDWQKRILDQKQRIEQQARLAE